MIIDDSMFNNHLRKLINIGLTQLENYKEYYTILNDDSTRQFLIDNDACPPHFKFLAEVIMNQKLTKCPECGHYNDNIECPIIRCEICDHEWKIDTQTSDKVCEGCIAFQTENCIKKPQRKV